MVRDFFLVRSFTVQEGRRRYDYDGMDSRIYYIFPFKSYKPSVYRTGKHHDHFVSKETRDLNSKK